MSFSGQGLFRNGAFPPVIRIFGHDAYVPQPPETATYLWLWFDVVLQRIIYGRTCGGGIKLFCDATQRFRQAERRTELVRDLPRREKVHEKNVFDKPSAEPNLHKAMPRRENLPERNVFDKPSAEPCLHRAMPRRENLLEKERFRQAERRAELAQGYAKARKPA
ncbi:MAG: hypothetical protein K2P46_02280 [Alistipes sp.]|nr:hypothetical protein [Alistipes sp.]